MFSSRTIGGSRMGIFDGGDAVNDLLIGEGDPLDGSTVSTLTLGRFGRNNSGQFAFVATLRAGFYLATPATGLLGNYNNDGSVDAAGYVVWRDNFGATASTGVAVPEAAATRLVTIGTIGVLVGRPR